MPSIAAEYVGDAQRVQGRGETMERAGGRLGGPAPWSLAARVALGWLCLLFAWKGPPADGLAAAAVIGALALDALARAALRLADREGALAVRLGRRFAGPPSLVLSFAEPAGPILLAGAMLVRPDAFALVATAGAGLLALGAVARLALARAVHRAAKVALKEAAAEPRPGREA
ncbi:MULTISPECIES: hypothetical protein [Methylobacterium]|uniref:CDP-alcohol phosphatidyltransferase n=2 Tax=Pseudomonadota TaxID=1224 RepID=A0ABQ4ST10_9HYPH|nr:MULTISPECIES: hypothetical protein [Methylobacterium]GBU15997.1 hypothetical protein AwMethylo_02120 [Methylobacterium sp.]GJE05629.1 hypothetical protein AOPFMNJM_0932 [Methylobacterium jeotgali]